ncbi:MAG: uroporphyrinogen decarboxylase [Pseudomonadota bacterium]
MTDSQTSSLGTVKQEKRRLVRALSGDCLTPPPVWLMRQAGRYLPEYQKLRAQAANFLDFCFTPDLALEATLQPIRRYGLDAAILFSDIMVVPYGLGQKVWFAEGEGPRLSALESERDLAGLTLESLPAALAPVYQVLPQIRAALPDEVALIGFAGAPWTLACYMIEGGASKDFSKAKRWAFDAPESFGKLSDLLVEATVRHLSAQIEAGAEVVQVFDSWAGVLPAEELRRWSLEPLREITRRLKAAHPEVPVILFPRAAGLGYQAFAEESGADGLSLDSMVPLDWARQSLQPHIVVQGNLDPALLLAREQVLEARVRKILDTLGRGPFVFNLGHGVVPATAPDKVACLIETVRSWTP